MKTTYAASGGSYRELPVAIAPRICSRIEAAGIGTALGLLIILINRKPYNLRLTQSDADLLECLDDLHRIGANGFHYLQKLHHI